LTKVKKKKKEKGQTQINNKPYFLKKSLMKNKLFKIKVKVQRPGRSIYQVILSVHDLFYLLL